VPPHEIFERGKIAGAHGRQHRTVFLLRLLGAANEHAAEIEAANAAPAGEDAFGHLAQHR